MEMSTAVLLFLSVYLLTISVEASNIECYSDFSESEIQLDQHCQVSFTLIKEGGCPVVETPIEFSSVGLGPQTKDSVNDKVNDLVNLDTCRLDGNRLVCNCDSDRCNKNKHAIWKTLLKTKFRLSEECRYRVLDAAWEQISLWDDDTNSASIYDSTMYCASSNSNLLDIGNFCSAEFSVLPGTCYIYGKPVLKARNNTDEDCLSKNTVSIACNTDNCNGDLEVLREKIEHGFDVSVDNRIDNCKGQLLQTIASWKPTSSLLTTKTTTKTTQQPTTKMTTVQTTTTASITPTTKPKSFKCQKNWAMSRRPVTNPYCFKVFDAPSTIKGYNSSEAFCINDHDARLATHEYSTDLEALDSTVSHDNFAAFLAGRNLCETLPCDPAKFAWHTMDGQWVPIEDRPMSIWDKGDPNQITWNNPPCVGVEACMLWANEEGDNYWIDTICDCPGLEQQKIFHVTKVACMKEAMLS